FLGLGDPDLLAGDQPAAVDLAGEGGEVGGVRAGVGLGHGEGHVQVTADQAGQETLFEVFAAVLDDRFETEDADVDGAAPVHARAGGGDLLFHDGGFGDAESAAAVLGGDGQAQPARLDDGVVELPGEFLRLVVLHPVFVGEFGAQVPDCLADVLVQRVFAEVHGVLPFSPRPPGAVLPRGRGGVQVATWRSGRRRQGW